MTVLAAAALAAMLPIGGWSADIDIYGPKDVDGSAPNVVFLIDNTSNWSAQNQAWTKASVDAKCMDLKEEADQNICLDYSEKVFAGAVGGKLEQGRIQLRALKLVLNELVCSGQPDALQVSVGLSLMGSQSVLNNGHGIGLINRAVLPLVGPTDTPGTTCNTFIEQLDTIDGKVQDPKWNAPSSANYGAAMYEIFKYFGGHTNPNKAADPDPNGGSPVGATGYGPIRYSKPDNVLDDLAAFSNYNGGVYKSPITAANSCGGNYVVLVGNGYPNVEPSNGDPTIFKGINYTPPSLDAVTSDVSRLADEWSYFLANTDVSPEPGAQRVFTYAVDVYNDGANNPLRAAQAKLLRSMAAVGGVGAAGYVQVGGDLYALINGFKGILSNIAAVNSVFTATTLPVSTTTQGTFLNQVFVGTFRPDAFYSPRWVGNLKQYQLGFVGGALTLVDRNSKPAVLSGEGFFATNAQSFWTADSVYFAQNPSGTPASASDSPDGAVVEKGGAAQRLREAYLQGASTRKVKTLSGGALVDFTTSSGFSADEVAWIRGENNLPSSDDGAELFSGAYSNAGTTTVLGTTGARHSMHGDVLHSRPVALNYGTGGVIVYYGANDGFFRAVDGRKTGATAGQELWSFIAPEHYDMLKRLRAGLPKVQLPETDAAGGAAAVQDGHEPRDYAMDGPIGVYALYNNADSVSKAWIFPTMRRGGRSVYAFDVSNPNLPGFKWKITGGETAGFDDLAQTWSMPKAVVTSSKTDTTPFLIMGGGYDPAEDQNGSSGVGNSVYIVNANDGSLIKSLPTLYSVPSDVTVVDVNGDGEPDRAYVADVRGNLYRIDFPTADPLTATAWTDVEAVNIANVGGKVFFAPDVVVTKSFVAVLVGTGDREKPLLNATRDRFVLIKDNVGVPRATTLGIGDLTRVATIDNTTMQPTGAVSGANDPEGCYLQLATNGEKVVNAPFSIAGATYFGTNRPTPVGAPICGADLGQAYAYKFPLFCGVPSPPSPLVGGGLPPSPVGGIVTIDVNGTPTQVPFLIGGTGPSAFDVGEPKPPIPPIRTRQHWRIDNNR